MISTLDAAVARTLQVQFDTATAARYLKRHGYSVTVAAAFLSRRR